MRKAVRRRLASCAGKVAHESKQAARQAAFRAMNQWGDSEMTAYRCRFCHWFHVGHPDPVPEAKHCSECRAPVVVSEDRFGAFVLWEPSTMALHDCG